MIEISVLIMLNIIAPSGSGLISIAGYLCQGVVYIFFFCFLGMTVYIINFKDPMDSNIHAR